VTALALLHSAPRCVIAAVAGQLAGHGRAAALFCWMLAERRRGAEEEEDDDVTPAPPSREGLPRDLGDVSQLALLPRADERQLARVAGACSMGLVAIWRVGGGGQMRCDTIIGTGVSMLPLLCLAALPGRELAAGGEEGLVRVWGAESGRLEATLSPLRAATERRSPPALLSLACLAGGARLVAGDAEGRLMIWSLATTEVLAAFAPHAGGRAQALLALPDGGLLSAGSGGDAQLLLWAQRAPDGAPLEVRRANKAAAGGGCAALRPLGRHHCAALGADGAVRVVALASLQPVRQLGKGRGEAGRGGGSVMTHLAAEEGAAGGGGGGALWDEAGWEPRQRKVRGCSLGAWPPDWRSLFGL